MKDWEPFQDLMRKGHQQLKQGLDKKQLNYDLYGDLYDTYVLQFTDLIMTMYRNEQHIPTGLEGK